MSGDFWIIYCAGNRCEPGKMTTIKKQRNREVTL